MESDSLPRKLAAILYADIAGYSRLTGNDDEGTHRILRSHLRNITNNIESNQGRVVHYAGDAVLADFPTVSYALACAIAVQKDLRQQNESLPEDRKVQFRIGINLGEVMADGGGIYGDGVNVAARLESLADPGGICISATVYDTLRTKLPLPCEYMGENKVKNINYPVRAYRVLMEPGSVANESGQTTLPIPNRLSIAVLPFTNMSGDPEQEYFADGLTEDIITNLSKFSELFVIARHSTFSFKGKAVSIQQVSQELGVRYVLEGSIQRAGKTVRITAQLIEASTGYHLWSERYDRKLDDIFVIRDEVTRIIAATLMGDDGRISKTELGLAILKNPKHLDAYDYTLHAIHCLDHLEEHTSKDNKYAMNMLKKAIALDPSYAMAYECMAWVYLARIFNNCSKNKNQDIDLALEWAKKAQKLDENAYGTHQILGYVYMYNREFEKSETAYKRASELNPNSPDVIADRAISLVYLGRPEEAIIEMNRAMLLNPFYPQWYIDNLGWAYAEAGKHDKAIEMLKSQGTSDQETKLQLADCYATIGCIEESQVQVQQIMETEPDFSLIAYEEDLKKTEPFKDIEQIDRHIKALRKAGLPE